MNKYEGPHSAYARNEGVYVPGSGINLVTGSSIAALIIRDFLRGYTYDSRGRKIAMDEDLFRRRLFYLIPLCIKHTGGSPECYDLKKIVEYSYKHHKLPVNTMVELAGENARKVANELVEKGIASIVRIYEPRKMRQPVALPKPMLRIKKKRERKRRWRFGFF